MVCAASCAIATVFIVAMIFTMYGSDKTDAIHNFKRILTPQQNEIYAKITNERRHIYFIGFGLGLLLSFIFWYGIICREVARVVLGGVLQYVL